MHPRVTSTAERGGVQQAGQARQGARPTLRTAHVSGAHLRLAELAPQGTALEVGWVARGCTGWWFGGLAGSACLYDDGGEHDQRATDNATFRVALLVHEDLVHARSRGAAAAILEGLESLASAFGELANELVLNALLLVGH